MEQPLSVVALGAQRLPARSVDGITARLAETPDRWIVGGALVFGGATETLKATSGAHSLLGTAGGVAIASAFVWSGLLARRRAPGNRTGILLVLVGLCVLAEDLVTARNPLLYTVGSPLHAVSSPALVWLALAYPSGRLGDRRLRALVVTAWLTALLVDPPSSDVFWQHHTDKSQSSLLVIANEPGIVDATSWAAAAIGAMVAGLCAAVLAVRWFRASPPARRLLGPFLGVAAALAATVAVGSLVRAHGGIGVTPETRVLELLLTIALAFAAVVGIQRSRDAQSRATEAVMVLGEDASVAAVSAALSQALDDPTLQILPLSPEHADGALVIDPALRQDKRLVETLARLAENALVRERRANDAQVRARTALSDAVEAERRRIERDLHDGAQQRLVAMALWFDVLEANLGETPSERALEVIARMSHELDGAIAELRELTHGSAPAVLLNGGLDAALAALVMRTPGTVTLHGSAGADISPTLAAASYFAAAEGVTNAVRHGRASRIELAVARPPDRLEIEVRDDGVGGASLESGSGLRGLRDRLAAHGGGLELESPPGGGTVFRVVLPRVEPEHDT
jgi:signal transduction histidine kinase